MNNLVAEVVQSGDVYFVMVMLMYNSKHTKRTL